MLAKQNEYLQEAVSGIAVLTEDEKIRQQCQAREDFEYWERMKENHYKRELEELTKQNNQYQQQLAEKDLMYRQQISEKDQQLAILNARIAELEAGTKQN